MVKEKNRENRTETYTWIKLICLDHQEKELGYLIYTISQESGQREFSILLFWVDPAYRRKQIGSNLLVYLKDACRNEGSVYKEPESPLKLSNIHVYIRPLEHNQSVDDLIDFYNKNGFQVRKLSYKEAWGTCFL